MCKDTLTLSHHDLQFKDGPCSRFLRSRILWQDLPSRYSFSPISAAPQHVLSLQQVEPPGLAVSWSTDWKAGRKQRAEAALQAQPA